MAYAEYKPKKFQLSGLEGISDKTLEMHFGLYEGYVKNTNLLMEQISESAGKSRHRDKTRLMPNSRADSALSSAAWFTRILF